IRQLSAPGLTRASKQPGGMLMLVDNSVVGSIIGKGGQNIRKISTESGASIQVQGRDEQSPSQLERRVTITSVSHFLCLGQRKLGERAGPVATHDRFEGRDRNSDATANSVGSRNLWGVIN
ncbi:unnamed protein product, partial [Hapterophycus canaliculatus]